MENRPLKRKKGSVLAVTLLVVSVLGGLLTLSWLRWDPLRKQSEDTILHDVLENSALDMLERVTVWALKNKPANPVDNSYGVVSLQPEDGLERLSIELPESLSGSVSGDVAVKSVMYWCVFSAPERLNWRIVSKDYPPSLREVFSQMETLVFSQSFEQVASGMAAAASKRERAAYKIVVTSALASASADLSDSRVVVIERVVAVER